MFFYGPDLLALLVTGIRAYDPYHAMPFDDLAIIANFSYRNSHFHHVPLLNGSSSLQRPILRISFSSGI